MILVALVSYFTYDRIAQVDISLAQRGILVARQLAPGAEFALFAGDKTELQRLADAAFHEADVRSITIADAQGQVLAHSGADESASDESVMFTQSVTQTQLAVTDLPEESSVPSGPLRMGEITVEMSRSAARLQSKCRVPPLDFSNKRCC
jgi:hypothetical protein